MLTKVGVPPKMSSQGRNSRCLASCAPNLDFVYPCPEAPYKSVLAHTFQHYATLHTIEIYGTVHFPCMQRCTSSTKMYGAIENGRGESHHVPNYTHTHTRRCLPSLLFSADFQSASALLGGRRSFSHQIPLRSHSRLRIFSPPGCLVQIVCVRAVARKPPSCPRRKL